MKQIPLFTHPRPKPLGHAPHYRLPTHADNLQLHIRAVLRTSARIWVSGSVTEGDVAALQVQLEAIEALLEVLEHG